MVCDDIHGSVPLLKDLVFVTKVHTGISGVSNVNIGTWRGLSSVRIALFTRATRSGVNATPGFRSKNSMTRSSISVGRRWPTHIESTISFEN